MCLGIRTFQPGANAVVAMVANMPVTMLWLPEMHLQIVAGLDCTELSI